MPDLDLYQGAYTGPQIDSSLAKVVGADTTPIAGSTNLVTSGGVRAAIDAMPVLSQNAIMIMSKQIAASGSSSWVTNTYDVDLTGYKQILLLCGVHGALTQSIALDVAMVNKCTSSMRPTISAYWDSGNMAQASIYNQNGLKVSITAKVNTFAADIWVMGFK